MGFSLAGSSGLDGKDVGNSKVREIMPIIFGDQVSGRVISVSGLERSGRPPRQRWHVLGIGQG